MRRTIIERSSDPNTLRAEWVKRGTRYYTLGDHAGVYEYRLPRNAESDRAFNSQDWQFWERAAYRTPAFKDNRAR